MSKSYILSRMDWAKAYRDYEALKVGKENLEVNSDFTKDKNISKWSNIYGSYNIINSELVKKVTTLHENNRVEFRFDPKLYPPSDVYAFIMWADIPTFRSWERLDNAKVIKQEIHKDFGVGIKPTLVTFELIDKDKVALLRFYTPNAPVGEVHKVNRYKIIMGETTLNEQWTPNPKDINAQLYPAQVARDINNLMENSSIIKREQLDPKLSGINEYSTVLFFEKDRVKSIKVMDGTKELSNVVLNYDSNGKLLKVVEHDDGRTISTTLNYDNNGKIISTTNKLGGIDYEF